MCNRLAVLLVLVFGLASGVHANDPRAMDKRGVWSASWRPRMSLPQALALAQKRLGPRFYCLQATVATTGKAGSETRLKKGSPSPECVWTLHFGSPSGKRREVWVYEGGQVKVYDWPRPV